MANASAQIQFLTDAAHLLRQAAPGTSAYLMRQRLAHQQQQAETQPEKKTFRLTDAQRQQVCTCCGHIMVPGTNGTTLKIQSDRFEKKQKGKGKEKEKEKEEKKEKQAKEKQSRKPTKTNPSVKDNIPPPTGIMKIYTCGMCQRDTRVALPPPAAIARHNKGKKRRATDEAGDNKTKRQQGEQGLNKETSTSTSTSKSSATTAATNESSANARSKKRAKLRKAGLQAMLGKKTSSGLGVSGFSFDDF